MSKYLKNKLKTGSKKSKKHHKKLVHKPFTRKYRHKGGWLLNPPPGGSGTCSNLDAANWLNRYYYKYDKPGVFPLTPNSYIQAGGDGPLTLTQNSNYYSMGGGAKWDSGPAWGYGKPGLYPNPDPAIAQYSQGPSIGNAHWPSFGSPAAKTWIRGWESPDGVPTLAQTSYNLYKDYAFAGKGGKRSAKKLPYKSKSCKKYRQRGGILGGSSGNPLFYPKRYQVSYSSGPAPHLTLADKLQLGATPPVAANACIPQVQGV